MSLKSINTIVLEEMDKYLTMITESLFEDEENKSEGNKEEMPLSKMSDKQRQTKARIDKANRRDGQKVGNNVSQEVRDFLNDPAVNVSDVMVQATGLSPTSASSLGAKIAKGERPVKAKLAQTVHKIQNQLG